MSSEACVTKRPRGLGPFERYLTLWVLACMAGGILLGRLAPGLAGWLEGLAIESSGAPVVSLPIAVGLFFMMFPIMAKIDFAEIRRAGRNVRPVALTLAVNWGIKPFTMLAIAHFFLGTLFLGFIGPDAVDLMRLPLGLDAEPGDVVGAGRVVLVDGTAMLELPLWRSYLAGCILLGIAPCTAMVLVWGYLARGNDGHTLVMVAVNSLVMLFLYGPLGGLLLGLGRLPVPWAALALSIGIYVALPLVAGALSRWWLVRHRGRDWHEEHFLPRLAPLTMVALLATLVLLFSFKGDVITRQPLTILWIAIPLALQTLLVFAITLAGARWLRLPYADAAPSALIGASNHFEVAIATAVLLYGLGSGAALATVVGVLIEVPLMLWLVRLCLRWQGRFAVEAG